MVDRKHPCDAGSARDSSCSSAGSSRGWILLPVIVVPLPAACSMQYALITVQQPGLIAQFPCFAAGSHALVVSLAAGYCWCLHYISCFTSRTAACWLDLCCQGSCSCSKNSMQRRQLNYSRDSDNQLWCMCGFSSNVILMWLPGSTLLS